MTSLYHYVGFTVVWSAAAVLTWYFGAKVLAWIYKKLPRWPWLLWTLWYGMRLLGKHNKPKNSFGPPFYFNEGENRAFTKQYRPTERQLQANLARYNRRRWAKMPARPAARPVYGVQLPEGEWREA